LLRLLDQARALEVPALQQALTIPESCTPSSKTSISMFVTSLNNVHPYEEDLSVIKYTKMIKTARKKTNLNKLIGLCT
jgi:hypothetical protein